MSEPTPLVPADLSFVTLAEFVTFLKKPSTELDDKAAKARLQESLGAATEAVQAVIGPLGAAGHEYVVFPSAGRNLVLPDTHLVSVTSVTDPYGRDLPVDARYLDLQAGVLTWQHRLHPGGHTVVATTREHGYSVKMAIKIIGSHLYDVNRGGNSRFPDDAMTEPGDPIARKTGFAIPRRAAELLRPFHRGS